MNLKFSALILFALSGLFFLTAPAKNACAQITINPPGQSSGGSVVIGTSSGGGITLPIPGFGSSSSGGGSSSSGGSSSGGGSGAIANQTCDTQVWQTMENRARLETEREMMQNQNLIFKADSVLNYTCFDSFAAHAAKNVGELFTHTTYFTGSPIIPWSGKYGMDYAMEIAIIESMDSYIGSNFGHSYLGGRGQYVGIDDPVINSVPKGGDNYDCDVMAEVWKVAKCLNFIHTQDFAETDGFYPYIDLKATQGGEDVAGYETIKDTRQFPTDCTGEPFKGSTWVEMYRNSRNENSFGDMSKYYAYSKPLRETYEAVRKLVEPGECGAAIPTGVQVMVSGGTGGYPDGVCTNPGCSYRKGGTCVAGGG